jgi:hypothetical protein
MPIGPNLREEAEALLAPPECLSYLSWRRFVSMREGFYGDFLASLQL